MKNLNMLFIIVLISFTSIAKASDLVNRTCLAGGKETFNYYLRSELWDADSSVLLTRLKAMYGWNNAPRTNWQLLSVPKLNVRDAAYQYQVYFAQKSYEQIGHLRNAYGNDAFQFLASKAKERPSAYSSETLSYLQNALDYYFDGDDEHQGYVDKFAGLICARYMSSGCKEAMNEANKIMNTHLIYNTNTSTPHLIAEIFSKPDYGLALANVALRMGLKLNRVGINPNQDVIDKTLNTSDSSTGHEAHTSSLNLDPKDNIADWLQDEFKKLGYNDQTAFKMMMNVMGLYATRGANTEILSVFAKYENYHVYTSYLIIAAGINLFDIHTIKDGRLFSMPKEIRTSCLYNNPYHFWMSAYLTHEMKNRGYKSRAAFFATHALSVGYQIFADNWGREPSRFLTEDLDSPMMNYMRATVAFNDAGAVWGLGKHHGKAWDLDNRHEYLLTNYKKTKVKEEDIEKILDNPAKHYLTWTSYIHHDSRFNWITGTFRFMKKKHTDANITP